MVRVLRAEALGDEELDRRAEEILPGVAEELLYLPIDKHDAALPVDDDHGVRGDIQEVSERGDRRGIAPAGGSTSTTPRAPIRHSAPAPTPVPRGPGASRITLQVSPMYCMCYIVRRVGAGRGLPVRSKMKPIVLAASLLLLAAIPVRAHGAAPAELTAREVDRLDAGEVVVKAKRYTTVDGTRAAKIRAYCVINKPPEAAWAVMLDYHKFDEFMPRLEKVQVLERTEHTMKVTEIVSAVFRTVRYTLNLEFQRAQRIVRWTLDKSREHDIADTSGAWEFLPAGPGQTIVRYTIAVNAGTFLPEFVEDYLTKNGLSETLGSFRRRTESDGTWKKEQRGADEDLRTFHETGRSMRDRGP
jgi:carbon monoxide dehydrogenase subunit G